MGIILGATAIALLMVSLAWHFRARDTEKNVDALWEAINEDRDEMRRLKRNLQAAAK